MNFKLVVATMSVLGLGLVCSPVFAATTDMSTTTTTTTTSAPVPVKHRHHHKMVKHHVVRAEPVERHEYKDMGALPVACTVSQEQMIMTSINQGVNRADPSNKCTSEGWFNRIKLAGGVNVDLGKFGNRNTNYMGENYQRFSLNDAYINLSADVNDWTKAFASVDFSNPTTNSNPAFKNAQFGRAEYSAAYSNNVASITGGNNVVQLEQAYATFGNFDVTPFYLQVGKSFQDFSRYEIHPITESLTQDISETLATALKVGFIANGFNGDIYAFDDPIPKVGQATKTTNYGLALGYDQPVSGCDQIGWDVGAAYLYNLIGVQDVAYNVTNNNFTSSALAGSGYGVYNSRVGAVALYGDVNSGPFTIGARYTSAVQRFNPLDLAKNGYADYVGKTILLVPTAAASGAKPWAAGIQAGYGFDAWGKDQNVYLGYQASREAAGLDLPKSRWLAGYGISAFGKNTNVGIEWDHDMAYNASNGGTGNNTNLVSVRSSVSFG